MAKEDVFGLIVRAVGIVLSLCGLIDALYLLAYQIGAPVRAGFSQSGVSAASIIYLVVGLALVVAATPITRLIYRFDK